ncbi:hypothetical protein HDU97_000531 [Phlyctochytrium planicorne]|nr:hypothetical protein HDU97_000531 [Phlyctochytrium planicorne]
MSVSMIKRPFTTSIRATMSLKPPFTAESAQAKVKKAEDLWNSMNPEAVSLAYTTDSIWRNRSEFLQGRPAIKAFLERKWAGETEYRLRKELFAFQDNKIAVQFFYEYKDAGGQWYRAYGLEDWTFDAEGLMQERRMSANDVKIDESERWFKNGSLERGEDPARLLQK